MQTHCGCGVTGSRARLRIWCRKAWGFESLHPHKFLIENLQIMNISKEQTGDYTASIKIDLTPEDFIPKVNESLEKTRKKANLPGFRPGKAPLGLVKRHYGKSAILDEVNHMAFENIYKYVVDSKLRIIGRPLINTEKTPVIDDLTEDRTYSFVFDIGILPEFDVNLSPETEIEFKKVLVTDEAVNLEIDALRKRHASFDSSDTVIDECMITGNLVITDEQSEETEKEKKIFRYFTIEKLDGNPRIKKQFIGAGKDDVIQIKNSEIDNREDLQFLIPQSIDLTKDTISVQFIPSDIYVSKLSDLNPEFFEKCLPGMNVTTEEEFKNFISSELAIHFERQCDDIFLNTVKKKLLQDIHLPLPAEFVKRFLMETSKEDGEDKLKDLEEKFEDYLDVIKWEFIQDKIFEKYEIKIGADDFKEDIRDFYRTYLKQDNVTDEQIQVELKQLEEDKKRMDSIEESIRRKKSLSLFKSHLTLKEKVFASFAEMTESEIEEKKPVTKEKKSKKKEVTENE